MFHPLCVELLDVDLMSWIRMIVRKHTIGAQVGEACFGINILVKNLLSSLSLR